MPLKFERLVQKDNVLCEAPPLTEEQLQRIEKDYLSAPLKLNGMYGPISWDTDFHFDLQDITKSYAYIKISILGFNIINGRLDGENPKITVDLTVAGVGVKAEVGINFNERRIYFKGTLDFIVYKTDYDFTILSF